MPEPGALKSLGDIVDPNCPPLAFPVNGKSPMSCQTGIRGQTLPHVKKNIWRDVLVYKDKTADGGLNVTKTAASVFYFFL